MNDLVLVFKTTGEVRGLYSELIDLSSLGRLEVARASTVEFNAKTQQWEVREPAGRLLYSHPSRAGCLAWEQTYFNHRKE